MIPSGTSQRVRAAFQRIQQVDLSDIKKKLMDKDHGQGWTAEQADRAELLYRCFLSLQFASDTQALPIVPPRIADEFWHQHILDTRKYAADCDEIFGNFLHHFPYFGMRGPADARALDQASEATIRLFIEHFHQHVGSLSTCAGKCSSCY